MEYHFTGKGDSPDFTFIADGIIDGSGKVISYSAIKSIKVKRRGNKAVLVIMVEENDTKVEYGYSVAPKDEESLKKAVADIEACYIKKRKGKYLLNWKIIGMTAAIFLLVCGGGLGWYANNSRELADSEKTADSEITSSQKGSVDNEPRIEFEETETTKRTDTIYNCPEYTVYPTNINADKIVWTTTDESVAKVENGMLYAGKEGTAQITATIDGNISASMTVNVKSKAKKTSTSSYNSSNDENSLTYSSRPGWITGGPGAGSTGKVSGKSSNQEYQNALTKGLSYAKNLHMSKKGVYDQLTSSYGEGFSADAAQYAIDNMTGVDWNANALEKQSNIIIICRCPKAQFMTSLLLNMVNSLLRLRHSMQLTIWIEIQ